MHFFYRSTFVEIESIISHYIEENDQEENEKR
jgi:hypothetical protein